MFRKFGILFKLFLLIALFGLFCFPLNAIAEDVDVEFEVVEDVTAPTEDKDLDEIIEEFIDEKGWTEYSLCRKCYRKHERDRRDSRGFFEKNDLFLSK